MNAKLPKIVVVTGGDGSGKSTLCKSLAKDPRFGTATHVGIWDGIEFSSLFRSELDQYLTELSPESRFLFLMHAQKNAIDRARVSDWIFLDGYWYKYAASELARGLRKETIENLASMFPKPDYTFYLDIDPEIALRRKEKLTQYEGGTPERYLELQRLMKKEWIYLEQRYGPWVRLGDGDSGKLVQRALSILIPPMDRLQSAKLSPSHLGNHSP